MNSAFSVQSMYGAPPSNPNYGVAAPTQQMGTSDIQTGLTGLIDPSNPLTWLGVILLITVGAAGAAGSVRLGKATVKASVGS
jgi:hypothetical protein